MRHIQYAVDEEGFVISRLGGEVAIPVLEYDRIGEGGDFSQPFTFHLEKSSVYDLAGEGKTLHWTRKIPVELKNLHRAFWGFSLLQ